MIKAIRVILHLGVCFITSLGIAKLQLQTVEYCESMCGFYYLGAIIILFPMLFLIGLNMAVRTYSKNSQLEIKKNESAIRFGVIGMVACCFLYSAFFYYLEN